jgi:hypothetical protein
MNSPVEQLCPMVTTTALDIMRLGLAPHWIAVPTFGEPPELVVAEGKALLASPRLAEHLPRSIRGEFHRLELEGRPPVLVRWNIPQWIAETKQHLGDLPLTLGGRRVIH